MKIRSKLTTASLVVLAFFTFSFFVSLADALAVVHNQHGSQPPLSPDHENDDNLINDPFSSSSSLSFPMIYHWSKRTRVDQDASGGGCMDPTEPFQCPGTSMCISLQFLCDGHAGDCPNNYDEDPALCVSAKRPPKFAIMTLLAAQVNNHGTKFIEYLFGKKALALFNALPHTEAINIITIALSVSPTIDEFASVIEMTDDEKRRFQNVLESLNNGQIRDLPPFIVNSAGEGLSTLAHQLIKTQFLSADI